MEYEWVNIIKDKSYLFFLDLYYSGDSLSSDQPQAFTCPFCSRMGFTEITLQSHVSTEHADSSMEVVCVLERNSSNESLFLGYLFLYWSYTRKVT